MHGLFNASFFRVLFWPGLLTSMALAMMPSLISRADQKPDSPGVTVYLTAQGTSDRLADKGPLGWGQSDNKRVPITIDDRPRFQTIEGFGGAFTESAAVTLQKVDPKIRQQVLEAYFDPQHGLGYTLCRTHINSCDFSVSSYAYDETPGDLKLKDFSIAHDRQALLPMIKDAQKISGGKLKLFASPWSPPAWMKTNGEMLHGGQLKPECRQVWADYLCRYIQEYAKEGVQIWGLTAQNEPAASQVWESCLYTPEEMRDFIRDYLGPTLHRAWLGDVKLMIWDHNRDLMYQVAQKIYDDPKAAKYVWGVGIHWYCGDHFDNVQWVHDAWPKKKILFTEGCQEGGPHTGEWAPGERYGHSMINDLNRWAVGWTDWNLALDEKGGPNHVGNYTSAPILVDTKSGQILYQNSYYYIGHFARFIKPGAQRIISASAHDDLETTAFMNPDHSIAVVVLNRTPQAIEFELQFKGKAVGSQSPAHSIQTLVFDSK